MKTTEKSTGDHRTGASDNGSIAGKSDLLRVALAAYAAHLEKHASVRIPGASTAWGRSARIASLRRFTR